MVFGFGALVALVAVAGAAVLGAVAAWHFDVKNRWVRGGVATVAIVLGGGAAILFFTASPIIRVKPDMTTSETLLLGRTTETIGGREVELLADGSHTTIIVNESERTLELRGVAYGSPGYVPGDTTVPPRSVHHLSSKLEYIGPDERPPSEISSKSDSEVRYWLTW